MLAAYFIWFHALKCMCNVSKDGDQYEINIFNIFVFTIHYDIFSNWKT